MNVSELRFQAVAEKPWLRRGSRALHSQDPERFVGRSGDFGVWVTRVPFEERLARRVADVAEDGQDQRYLLAALQGLFEEDFGACSCLNQGHAG